jgi:hypothetical protein
VGLVEATPARYNKQRAATTDPTGCAAEQVCGILAAPRRVSWLRRGSRPLDERRPDRSAPGMTTLIGQTEPAH